MRRRLDIAASLIGRPRVVFLDEPTTGLDPRSRITMWEFIADLVRDGTTILLTTQYLEEADRLADSIIVLNKGKIIARGTADELKAQTGGERIEFVLTDRSQADRAKEILTPIGVEPPTLDEQVGRIVMPVNGGSKDLSTALSRLEAAGIGVVDVGLRRPNLDDVFLSLTGQTTGEPEAAEEEK
jgi:ABC-2 type transport system ATP-binding protein